MTVKEFLRVLDTKNSSVKIVKLEDWLGAFDTECLSISDIDSGYYGESLGDYTITKVNVNEAVMTVQYK